MRHSTVTERNPKAIARMEPSNLGFFTAAAEALGRTGHRGKAAIGIVGSATGRTPSSSLDPLQRRLRRRRTHHSWSVSYTHGRLRCMPRSETA
jgi:hypothetical protein